MRSYQRAEHQPRPIAFHPGFSKHAPGSCLVRFGDTVVLCTASVEDKVPAFLRGTREGWIVAEYGMLPQATQTRSDREAVKGKQKGRTQEIQRLIGRALRAAFDLKALGERQIFIDCDVLQADGGTRCAAICGAYIAVYRALAAHTPQIAPPVREPIAAISGGIVQGKPLLDLDYSEDSRAAMDGNFVLTPSGKIVEIQVTGEDGAFAAEHLQTLLSWTHEALKPLFALQRQACVSAPRAWETVLEASL